MQSPRYGTPLRIRVGHSVRLRAVFILFLSLCVVSLLLAQVPPWLKVAVFVVLIVVGLKSWRERPELGGEACELVLRGNGGWLCGDEKLELLGESVVSYPIAVLMFSGDKGKRAFVLWRREVDGGVWRRLGVYLELYGDKD